jgi:cellulose synthase/poly-beta-1,6-N-acetylglucosamine synthase-like glycosyltransferase
MSVLSFKILFWFGLCLVVYTYLGYGLVIWTAAKLKRNCKPPSKFSQGDLPSVSFVVCAFNEADYIAQKIENSISLHYPKERLHFFFVTDGSNDETPFLVQQFPFPADIQWTHLHQPERRGKIAAFQRAMQQINTEMVVSTDANTLVNPEGLLLLIQHFSDPKVGVVAGEKRISMDEKDNASSAGEGIYWKYESWLKKLDAQVYSVIGAAGELFAFRREAYEEVPADTLVEDFYLTMRMAEKGWRLAYEPHAYAVEKSSASVAEEMKRKVRIAAGGLQAVARLSGLLNIFKHGILSFQYISHRVLRWTLAPLFLPLIFLSNVALVRNGIPGYSLFLMLQCLFYAAAALGWMLETKKVKIKAFFVPYYFCLMNWAMYAGFIRLIQGKQSVVWEKAKRS